MQLQYSLERHIFTVMPLAPNFQYLLYLIDLSH